MTRLLAKATIVVLAFGLLAVAAGCPPQPVAPDREDVPPGPAEQPDEQVERERRPLDDEHTVYSAPEFQEHLRAGAQVEPDVLRPGEAFQIDVLLETAENWYVYGNPVGPGIGQPTTISVQGPEGFQFDSPRYDSGVKAQQQLAPDETTWVWQFRGQTIHHLPGQVEPGTSPGEYEATVTVSGQLCDPAHCIPGTATIPVRLTVGES